jgi:FAD:protein FMN transferase
MKLSEVSERTPSLEKVGVDNKKKPVRKWLWGLASLTVVFLTALGFRLYNQYWYHFEKQTRFMMDTYVTIYAVGPESITKPAMDLAFSRLEEINVKFNSLNPKSPIYSFNEKGTPITDPEIIEVARMGLKVAEESRGAFDITVEPLIELWGFYGNSPNLPKDEDIQRCLENVDYHYLELTGTALNKRKPGVKIELGGIAVGWAVGQAATVLKQNGVTSALIDGGGEIFALGRKGRDPWKVGVKNPRKEGLVGYVEVEDLAVTGAGDYEHFFMKDGKRYSHIFNPKTGYPVDNELAGVTIIHPDPFIADAWDTPIVVLGMDEGMRQVENHPGMAVIMVTDSGEIKYSNSLKNSLVISKN